MHANSKYKNKLSHLTPSEVQTLMSDYYRGKITYTLIKRYEIDVPIKDLHKTFPLQKAPEHLCIYCKESMYKIPQPKESEHIKEYLCTSCNHIDGPSGCICKNCVIARQDDAHKIRMLRDIQERSNSQQEYLDESKSLGLEELSLKERVYIGALLKSYPITKEGLFKIKTSSNYDYAPSTHYANHILSTLIEKNIIFEVAVNLESITLAVNIKKICTDATIISSLIDPAPTEINAEFLEIIREVQIYEGVAYFTSVLENYRLHQSSQADIKERFEVLFLNILKNDYCVAQLFNFIFSAIRNIAAGSNHCSRDNKNILEKIYNNMSNNFDKAQHEHWKIKNFHRGKNQASSSIFKLISNDLLGVRESLLYEPICDIS